jgi:hypothetical protein
LYSLSDAVVGSISTQAVKSAVQDNSAGGEYIRQARGYERGLPNSRLSHHQSNRALTTHRRAHEALQGLLLILATEEIIGQMKSGAEISAAYYKAVTDELDYLDLERTRLKDLNRNPDEELGDSPPWLRH